VTLEGGGCGNGGRGQRSWERRQRWEEGAAVMGGGVGGAGSERGARRRGFGDRGRSQRGWERPQCCGNGVAERGWVRLGRVGAAGIERDASRG
jgi:hypothetical protein